MPIKHSGGDVRQEVNYVNLEFVGEIQAGDKHTTAEGWCLKQGNGMRSVGEWALEHFNIQISGRCRWSSQRGNRKHPWEKTRWVWHPGNQVEKVFLQGEQNELLYQKLLVGKSKIRTETCLVDQCKGCASPWWEEVVPGVWEEGNMVWFGQKTEAEKLKTEFRHTF